METSTGVDDCKKRWKCIRDSYLKIKKSQKTTTGQAAVKRPKWSLYELLSLLDSIPTERRSVNTLQPIEEESIGTDTDNFDFQEQHENSVNETSSQNEDEDETASIQRTPLTQSTTNQSFKKRQQRTSDSQVLEELKKRSADRTALMSKILKDEDEVDIFMHSIAVQVKKLSPKLIAEAKIGILTLVNELQFHDTQPQNTSSLNSSISSNNNSTQSTSDLRNFSADSQLASQVQHPGFPFSSTSDSDLNYVNL